MCLIISNPNCLPVPREHIASAYMQNSDGFGLMWAIDGKLKTYKGRMNLQKINSLFDQIAEVKVPYVAHFRYATHGTKNDLNCHPFRLGTQDFGGMAMMHNGTLSGSKWRNASRSDTSLLAEEITEYMDLKLLYPEDVSFNTDKIQSLYNEDLGSDKLVFMNGDGDISYVNEKYGHWKDGLWYSNLYSIGHFTASELGEWDFENWTWT